KVRSAGISEKGPIREANEDALLIDDALGLYIVCDGMGGAAGGAKASQLAISAVHKCILELQTSLEQPLTTHHDRQHLANILRGAILFACSKIYQESIEHPELTGMGTTLTAVLIRGGVAVMGHVGDSRLYLLRDQELHLLSSDHTVVHEMVLQGVMTPEEALLSPHRHILSRALGVSEAVQVDTLIFDLLLDDRLFLVSDGIFDVFSSSEISPLFSSKKSPAEISQHCIREALHAQSEDNVTALVLHMETSDEQHTLDEERQGEVTLKLERLRTMYLFQRLELPILVRLVEHSLVRSLSKGEILFEEGDAGDSLYIILRGSLEVIYHDTILATLHEGNHVGEMSLLDDSPRTATIRSCCDTTVLQLSRSELLSIAREDPHSGVDLFYALSRELSSRLRKANEALSNMEGHSL
ncbi:MAG: cyclic nucleotide-binding domain-containing protein, partial [Bdellovibrionales bacterium]|nr:cyclic nucleotide-binding domain-containing protein [Bdellovibrionales bacterium]